MKNFFKKSRSNKGFSLVELIVVIAIMAIIAGVSIPIYNVYIDKAEKGNDVALVGDVIKALEIGVNSAQFVPSNSIQISATTYPVGFVVLTNGGIKVLTSGTQVITDDRQCVYETIENVTVKTPHTYTASCCGKTDVYYTVSNGDFTYCKTHSPAPNIEDLNGKKYESGYTHSRICILGSGSNSAQYLSYDAGSIGIENQTSLYVEKSSGKCEYAYANSTTIDSNHIVNGANGVGMDITHPIYQSLSAAYGDISQINLGMPREKLKKLFNNISCVVNSAAKVSHYGKYELFKCFSIKP